MSTSFKLELDALIPARRCQYTADEQALIHRASGIEATDPWLDPFLAFMAGVYDIGEAISGQFPNRGAVIISQNVSIKGHHPIDAPAFVQGRVTAFDASPRGHVMAGLLPILFTGGAGVEIMRRIAAPLVGGMISAPLLSLFVIPAAYLMIRHRGLEHADRAMFEGRIAPQTGD